MRGKLYSVTNGNPGAGVDWTFNVPAGKRWRLHGGLITLTTSAAVANRLVRFRFYDGASHYFRASGNFQQAASIVCDYVLAAGLPPGVVTPVGSNPMQVNIPVPVGMEIAATPGVSRIVSVTDNIQAADQWTAQTLWVEEWDL